jgi:hypothetical protein
LPSRGHSAHIGQDRQPLSLASVVRKSARRIQAERRATGEFVHVELAPGVVTVLPVWKLDAAYYADLKVGAPQVSLATLYTNPRRG